MFRGKDIDFLNKAVRDLARSVKEISEKIDHDEQNLYGHDERIGELGRQVNIQLGDMADVRTQIRELQHSHNLLSENITLIGSKVEPLSPSMLQSVSESIEVLGQRIETLEDNIGGLTKYIGTIDSKLDQTEEQIQVKQSNSVDDGFKQDLQRLMSLSRRHEMELEQIKEQESERVSIFGKLVKQTEMIERHVNKLQQLEQEVSGIKEDLALGESQVALTRDQGERVEQLENRLLSAQALIAKLEVQRDNLENEVQIVKEETGTLRTELRNVEA